MTQTPTGRNGRSNGEHDPGEAGSHDPEDATRPFDVVGSRPKRSGAAASSLDDTTRPLEPLDDFDTRWTARPRPVTVPRAPETDTRPLDVPPDPLHDGTPPDTGTASATPEPAVARRTWRRRVPWGPLQSGAAWVAALVVLFGAAYTAWWFIQPQLHKPFVYDEAAFAFAGHAVAETGVPLSNVGHMQTEVPGDFSKRFNWALWHPPLYVFTLGWAFSRWGETEQTARLVGVACNAIAALFAFGVGTLALRGRTRAAPLYAAAGTAMYLTSPFVIQSALLLDIDGTVLVASISLLAFCYTLLLGSRAGLRSPWYWLLLGMTAGAFGLSLWAKMTTAFALPAAAAIYRLLAKRPWRPWRLLIELPVVIVVGGALFLGTWWLACQAKGMPFLLPFIVLDHELRDAAGSTSSWRENPRVLLELVSYVALWVSPYLIFLFVWSGLARVYDLLVGPVVSGARRVARRAVEREGWGMRPMDLALMAGAGIGAAYLIKLAASFPKYHISMMPFWAVGIAYLLSRYVKRFSWWEPPAYAVVVAGMAGYFVSFVGDKYVLFKGFDFVLPMLVWPAALGLAFLVLSGALGQHHLPRQLTILGLLLTLSWSWGVNLAQSLANYSTAYNYATAGQTEAAAHLDRILRPDQPFIATRDVAYYTKRSQVYVDEDTFWEHLDRIEARGLRFDGSIAGYPRVDVVELFLWEPTRGERAHAHLDHLYEVEFMSLPYVVFVRTSP